MSRNKIYTNVVPFYSNGTRIIDVFDTERALDDFYGPDDYRGPGQILFAKIRKGQKSWEMPKTRTGYKWKWDGYLLENKKGWRYIEVPKKRRNHSK